MQNFAVFTHPKDGQLAALMMPSHFTRADIARDLSAQLGLATPIGFDVMRADSAEEAVDLAQLDRKRTLPTAQEDVFRQVYLTREGKAVDVTGNEEWLEAKVVTPESDPYNLGKGSAIKRGHFRGVATDLPAIEADGILKISPHRPGSRRIGPGLSEEAKAELGKGGLTPGGEGGRGAD